MKKPYFLPRFLALWLTLSLSLPSPVWALRTGQKVEQDQAGMEELEQALRSGDPGQIVRLAGAVLTSPAVSIPTVRPELVEGRMVPQAAAGAEEIEPGSGVPSADIGTIAELAENVAWVLTGVHVGKLEERISGAGTLNEMLAQVGSQLGKSASAMAWDTAARFLGGQLTLEKAAAEMALDPQYKARWGDDAQFAKTGLAARWVAAEYKVWDLQEEKSIAGSLAVSALGRYANSAVDELNKSRKLAIQRLKAVLPTDRYGEAQIQGMLDRLDHLLDREPPAAGAEENAVDDLVAQLKGDYGPGSQIPGIVEQVLRGQLEPKKGVGRIVAANFLTMNRSNAAGIIVAAMITVKYRLKGLAYDGLMLYSIGLQDKNEAVAFVLKDNEGFQVPQVEEILSEAKALQGQLAAGAEEKDFNAFADKFGAFLKGTERQFKEYHGTAWRRWRTKFRMDQLQGTKIKIAWEFILKQADKEHQNLRFVADVGMLLDSAQKNLDKIRAGNTAEILLEGYFVRVTGQQAADSFENVEKQTVGFFPGGSEAAGSVHELLDLNNSEKITIPEYLEWRRQLAQDLQDWGNRLMALAPAPAGQGWPGVTPQQMSFQVFPLLVSYVQREDLGGEEDVNLDSLVTQLKVRLSAEDSDSSAGLAGVPEGVAGQFLEQLPHFLAVDDEGAVLPNGEFFDRFNHINMVVTAIALLDGHRTLSAATDPAQAVQAILSAAPPSDVSEGLSSATKEKMARRMFEFLRAPAAGAEEEIALSKAVARIEKRRKESEKPVTVEFYWNNPNSLEQKKMADFNYSRPRQQGELRALVEKAAGVNSRTTLFRNVVFYLEEKSPEDSWRVEIFPSSPPYDPAAGAEEKWKGRTVEDLLPVINAWLEELTFGSRRPLKNSDLGVIHSVGGVALASLLISARFVVEVDPSVRLIQKGPWKDGSNLTGWLWSDTRDLRLLKVFTLPSKGFSSPAELIKQLAKVLAPYQDEFHWSHRKDSMDATQLLLRVELTRILDAVFPEYHLADQVGAFNQASSQETNGRKAWNRFNQTEEQLLKATRRGNGLQKARKEYRNAQRALEPLTWTSSEMWVAFNKARRTYWKNRKSETARDAYVYQKALLAVNSTLIRAGLEDRSEVSVEVAEGMARVNDLLGRIGSDPSVMFGAGVHDLTESFGKSPEIEAFAQEGVRPLLVVLPDRPSLPAAPLDSPVMKLLVEPRYERAIRQQLSFALTAGIVKITADPSAARFVVGGRDFIRNQKESRLVSRDATFLQVDPSTVGSLTQDFLALVAAYKHKPSALLVVGTQAERSEAVVLFESA